MATNTGTPVNLNKNASGDTVANALLTGQNANMDKINTAIDGLNKNVIELKSRQMSSVALEPNSNYEVASAAWYVKSGICFVRFDATVTTRAESWIVAGTGVPIPVYGVHRGVASSPLPDVAGLNFQINTEGKLIFSAGQAGIRYWGEFSYPIDSYKA